MWEAIGNDFYNLEPGQKNKTEQISQQNSLSENEKKMVWLFLNQTLEDTQSKVNSLVKWFSWKEQHLINYLNNLDYKDNLDDFMQIAEIKEAAQKQLWELKQVIESQNETPFQVAWGQIYTKSTYYKWSSSSIWDRFKPWYYDTINIWKELWDDKIQYLWKNKWEITMDNRWFSYSLVLEYNWRNIVKIHDERYGTVERITVTSKEISVQDMERKWYNKITIESYTKLREINIPFRGQQIRLQLIFHK
jgi:hypothetical protein